MQLYPPCDPDLGEDIFHDEVTQRRQRNLREQLAQQIRVIIPHPKGIPSPEEVPRACWQLDSTNPEPPLERIPLVRWGGSASHYLGSRSARSSTTMQRLHTLLNARRYAEFRAELARVELLGEIPEFYALNFQAILAVVEGAEFARDYLEMAEAVAASPYELAVIAENLAAHDLLQGNPLAAAKRCAATLDHVCQTEGLWNNLLIALYRLGEVETVDATLRGFTRLDDECTARLLDLLLADPDLCDVRARPAFRELLDKRAAG